MIILDILVTILLFVLLLTIIVLYYRKLLAEQQKRLKSYSLELETHIVELEASNNQVKELSLQLEKIIELTENLYESTLKDEEVFLNNLLHAASLLIPDADYGSVYIYKNDRVYFIDAIGHDLKGLQELYIEIDVFVSPTDEITIIDNVVDYTINRISNDIKEKFSRSSKSIKQTLKFDLFVNDILTAGVSLDIASDSEKIFNENSKKTMQLFRNFASAFFNMQRFGQAEREFQQEIVYSIIQLLEIHDNYTKNHSHNVAILSQKIATELNLPTEEINNAYWAGLVHDIGKILIPFNVLNKKDKLSEEEFNHIKKHPHWGFVTLSQTKHLKEIAKYVLYHHEYWDGTGYPKGVKGNDIPLVSQIITVADSWDAMRSDRSYRSKLATETALREIINKKGLQFSPVVVEAFVNIIERENLTLDNTNKKSS